MSLLLFQISLEGSGWFTVTETAFRALKETPYTRGMKKRILSAIEVNEKDLYQIGTEDSSPKEDLENEDLGAR